MTAARTSRAVPGSISGHSSSSSWICGGTLARSKNSAWRIEIRVHAVPLLITRRRHGSQKRRAGAVLPVPLVHADAGAARWSVSSRSRCNALAELRRRASSATPQIGVDRLQPPAAVRPALQSRLELAAGSRDVASRRRRTCRTVAQACLTGKAAKQFGWLDRPAPRGSRSRRETRRV